MTRNIDRRVEVTCPIYDKDIQHEIKEFINFQLSDNKKSRIIDRKLRNRYTSDNNAEPVRAQVDFYRHIREKNKIFSDDIPGIATGV